jgi:hypothetical protein
MKSRSGRRAARKNEITKSRKLRLKLINHSFKFPHALYGNGGDLTRGSRKPSRYFEEILLYLTENILESFFAPAAKRKSKTKLGIKLVNCSQNANPSIIL